MGLGDNNTQVDATNLDKLKFSYELHFKKYLNKLTYYQLKKYFKKLISNIQSSQLRLKRWNDKKFRYEQPLKKIEKKIRK